MTIFEFKESTKHVVSETIFLTEYLRVEFIEQSQAVKSKILVNPRRTGALLAHRVSEPPVITTSGEDPISSLSFAQSPSIIEA